MISDLSTTVLSKQEIEAIVDQKLSSKFADFQDQLTQMQAQIQSQEGRMQKEKVTIVVSSNDYDRLMPAFIIATGAASFGMEVTLFFTLWGINALKKKSTYAGKGVLEQMMTFMMPSKPEHSGLSKMNMGGMGAFLMKYMMKQHNVESLPNLMNLAVEMDVKLVACQMTMGIMGITREEIRDGVTYGGVAMYIEEASESKITLFI